MSRLIEYISQKAVKRAELEVNLLNYLSNNKHRQVSVTELANVFNESKITIRNCLLPHLKDGFVQITHQTIEIFYEIKNEKDDEEDDLDKFTQKCL